MDCEMYFDPDGEAEYDIHYLYHYKEGEIDEWRATHQKVCRFCAGQIIEDTEPSHIIRIDRL
jgi:hypothetical protein